MSRATAGSLNDRIAGVYELIADTAERRAKDRGLQLLATAPGARALEIGTGSGRALERLARDAGAAGAVWGLDLCRPIPVRDCITSAGSTWIRRRT